MKIFRSILLLILLSYCTANEVGAKISVNLNTMTALKNQIVPIVMSKTKEIVIGDIILQEGFIELIVNDIVFKDIVIPKEKVVLNLLPNQNEFEVNVQSVTSVGTFKGRWRFGLIKGSFSGTAKLKETGANLKLAISHNSTGGMIINVKSCILKMDVSNIDLQISGGVIGKIIDFLQKAFKKQLVDKMKNNVQSMMPKTLDSIISVITERIPSAVDLGSDLELSLRLPANPHIDKEYMAIGIEGCIVPKGSTERPSYKPSPYPDYDTNTKKGMQFFISDYVLRTGLEAVYKQKLLVINYNVSLGFITIFLDCFVTKEPTINLTNNMMLTAVPMCNITAKNSEATYDFGVLAVLNSEVSAKLKNLTVYFNILNFTIVDLKIINPHEYELDWFKFVVKLLINQAIGYLNDFLETNGVELPSIKEISYTEPELVTRTYLELMTIPIVHLDVADFAHIN